ncbi:MAG: nucleoside deaminase [Planctomycetota bacterium]|nr:nucleoside deaminase [Planctomycetota bacterium]
MKVSEAKRFMRMAIRKAAAGIKKGQTPFGACIVKDGRDGKVVSCEHNVVWKTTDITAHAEVHAIRSACRRLRTIDLSGCVIYTTCEPCTMCMSACHWARIGKIVFGASIADAQKAGFNELVISARTMKRLGRSPVKIVGGFLRREARALFALWSASKDRRVY